MPARLAVRTQPLRWSLCRGRTTLSSPNVNTWRRWYGSQGRCIAANGRPFAYTWLTKTPEVINPGSLVATIDPIRISTEKPQNAVLLLLVTPGFAPWIDTDSGFLHQCVNQLYDFHNSSSNTLRLVAAVVDGLPDPSERRNSEVEQENELQDKKGAQESEGISLLLLAQADVLGKAIQPRRIRSSEVEEPALALSVETIADKAGAPVRHPTYDVGLRLANTTFVNGKEHTLLGMRWKYDTTSGRLEVDQCVNLTSCVIRSAAQNVHDSYKLPLHPVSERRRVTSSMGNILSQVAKHPDGDSPDSIPASIELEKELPRYADEHDIVDQRVSVWALLEKPHCTVPPKAGTSAQDRVTESLRAGCKLLRVMSGGGGWGKKQGLLSLDPETSFAEVSDRGNISSLDELFDATGAPHRQDGPPPIDDLISLSQLVDPDDYVQFFVSVDPRHLQDGHSGLLNNGIGTTTSFQFGVMSGVDGEVEEAIERKDREDIVVLPHYFGALSRHAITYAREGKEASCTTKLDVPGSRVELALV